MSPPLEEARPNQPLVSVAFLGDFKYDIVTPPREDEGNANRRDKAANKRSS